MTERQQAHKNDQTGESVVRHELLLLVQLVREGDSGKNGKPLDQSIRGGLIDVSHLGKSKNQSDQSQSKITLIAVKW